MRVTLVDETLDGTNTSVTSEPVWLGPDNLTRLGLHAEYNHDTSTAQTLASTAAYEASNDPRVREDIINGTSTADWDDITADITAATDIDAVTGAGDGSNVLDNFNYEFFRVVVSRDSGEGDYKLWLRGATG